MATREELINTPRSGAKPLFGGSGSGEPRSYPRYSRSTSTSRTSGPSPSRPSPSRPSSPPAPRAKATPAPRAAAPSGRSGLATANAAVRSSRQFAAPEFKEYQGIILAEFVAAELLVATTPIATRANMPGLSPYIPKDMMKMLSIGMLFFILELMAVGGHSTGRFAAWFGGLILIVVGLNEATNIVKDLDLFAGINPNSSSTTTKQATGTTQAPGTTTAGGRG